jgi:hypothetical protein
MKPLPINEDRCFGRNCNKLDECQRHKTISHRDEPWAEVKPPFARLCPAASLQFFIEIKNADNY